MKKNRVIIPALGLIALGTAASITGTVAWFSANNAVTLDGMTVTTSVGSNLFIKKDTLGSTAKIADADFLSSDTQTIAAKLEPVSTKNAKAFFYTVNGKADGDAVSDDYKAYNAAEVPTSGENSTFSADYATTGAVGYVDYVFQLKGTNTQAVEKDIKLTKLDMVYSNPKDESTAWRAAVLVENITTNNPAGGSGDLLGIYSISGAQNQNRTGVIDHAVGAASTAPSVLDKAYNNVLNIASLDAGATGQYKVVVRLWLEGEDKTCKTSTFAKLNGEWTLDLELKIEGSSAVTAVDSITRYTNFVASNTTKYCCDGTSVYVADTNGKPSGDALTSAGLANPTLESELEGAFGVAIA